MGYAHDYATAIMHRGRTPMPPADFVPDWGDAPRRFKLYSGAVTFPLPDVPVSADADAPSVAAGFAATGGDEPFDLASLSAMLRFSYAIQGRRLAPTANSDLASLPRYQHANWYRGTASGGGLYPCSTYWIAGPGADVNPGVYYYSPAEHGMQRLLAGDVVERLRRIVGPVADDATQFLVVGVKYWQNAFKYNSFSYHAVTMDVGTTLQTWRTWAAAHDRQINPVLWFDQADLSDLLGLEPDAEGLFAVVPIAWDTAEQPSAQPGAGRVVRTDKERSKVVIEFETITKIHRATAAAADDRLAVGSLREVGAVLRDDGVVIELPEPDELTMPLVTALRRRRSSFGRFEGRPITASELAASLAASVSARIPNELDGPDDGNLVKLYVFVNHVTDIPPGVYEYAPEANALRLISTDEPGAFLQESYFLANYNLEQTAAVVVPSVRTHAVLDAVGDRGYNLVNATIGAVSQNFYTAAAALGLGAGVALGFDNISYAERLGITVLDEAPLLIMLLGHERAGSGDYHYELG
ncbi:nitroreductase family protein [Cellulosimicrobium sp. PMB13]|uniref:nitroreductase family protein n=1 Tax=Cellulosimicrobium sp. PMB13 TaxID=3120158 RepID=UPI003F4BB5DB